MRIAGSLRGFFRRVVGPRRRLRRSYQAAQVNRLTADWATAQTTANSELRQSLRNLRARSRELARNNDYVKKFLGMVVNNVVGPKGFTLQVRPAGDGDQIDEPLAKIVEEKFAEWAHKETASASGRLSWLDLQRLFVRCVARDGEVLVRKIVADNPFGFALKVIDASWLDEAYNEQRPDGNRVLMSVEVDENDRPVAYWLTPPTQEYLLPAGVRRTRTRVDAREIIHAFLVTDDESQTRGVPWAHTAMVRLQILAGYEEAEVVAARVGACKGGFLIPPAGDETEGVPGGPQESAQIVESVEPGMLPVLPEGYTFQEYNPQHPNNGYAQFHKTCLSGIASGLEVSYFSLANDLTAVNYSSARVGLLEERDVWRALQAWVVEHFCRPVFRAWAESAMLTGELPVTAAQYRRIGEPRFMPRGWMWVDPVKDVTAAVVAINNALGTRTDVFGEGGEDFEDKVALLAAEQKLLKEKGIALDTQGLSLLAALAAPDDGAPAP